MVIFSMICKINLIKNVNQNKIKQIKHVTQLDTYFTSIGRLTTSKLCVCSYVILYKFLYLYIYFLVGTTDFFKHILWFEWKKREKGEKGLWFASLFALKSAYETNGEAIE